MGLKFHKDIVTENGRTMVNITPDDGKDPAYTKELREAEKEKTSESLKKQAPKPVISDSQRKENAGILKEITEFRERKKNGTGNRKYF